jgi:LPXTG-motif cell wall-anchored protein
VGSTISVQLTADPSDASVTPNGAIDKSIGEHTALLWTWYVRATHPNTSPGLFLTAEIVTKMSDGHVLQEELALTIPVDRTLQYTVYQIFTNWATWAAIVGAFAGLFAWIWKKRKKEPQEQPPSSKVKTSETS